MNNYKNRKVEREQEDYEAEKTETCYSYDGPLSKEWIGRRQ